MKQVHRFRYKDKLLVFDVQSSALHEVSPVAWAVIDLLEQGLKEPDITGRLNASFGAEKVAEALDELGKLREQGLLWSEGPGLPPGPEPVVKALCLFATDHCSLSCRYCFAGRHSASKPAAMSPQVGRAAVDFLMEAAGERRHCEIDFFGGEPLLNWPVVLETAEYARKEAKARGKEVSLTLTTNGLLLDERIIECLLDYHFAVVLSLDGRPAVHDRMRPRKGGGGSYAETIRRHIPYIERQPPGGYYVRGTFTRFNMDFCEDVRHLYDLGYRYISMEPVVAPPEADYALRMADLPALAAEYERLVDFYLACRAAGDPFHFFHFNIDLEGGPCLQKRLSGCGAGQEYLAVAPGGEIYPCHQLTGIEEFKLGDVFCRLADIRETAAGSLQPPGPLAAPCRQCWARYHCGGGCKAASYHNGDPDLPYPLECAMQKMRLECALFLQAAAGGESQ